jgi:hypothetical protein
VKLSEFVKVFVAALYNETMLKGSSQFRVGEILDRYGLEVAPVWQDRILDDNELQYYVDIHRHIGPVAAQRIALTPEGFRWVEDELGDNLAAFLEQHGASYTPETQRQPDIESDAIGILDSLEAKVIPASDRIVTLDHNAPAYAQVRDGLEDLLTKVRENNEVGESAAHRQRLLHSLEAAQKLWDAAELKLIQIQVGVVLAIEDAGTALKTVGKLVAIGLMIDAIKALVKASTGIDF